MIRFLLCELARMLACCSFLIASATVFAEPDISERPALHSEKASLGLFNAVAQIGERFVAVGERGTVLVSDDAGRTWNQATVPVSVTLNSVAFPSPDRGFAVGHSGVLLESRDQGLTWQKRLDGNQINQLVEKEAQAQPDNHSLQKLAEQFQEDGPDKPLLSIAFLDAQHGFALGAFGLMLTTRDGGTTWFSATEKAQASSWRHLYSIIFAERIFIAGEQGTLLDSAGQGEPFKKINFPYKGSMFGGVVSKQGDLLVYGLRGHAFLSEDHGQNWKPVPIDSAASLSAGLLLADGAIILANESGSLFRSLDNGHSFQPIRYKFPGTITAMIQVSSDSLLLASTRGLVRLSLNDLL